MCRLTGPNRPAARNPPKPKQAQCCWPGRPAKFLHNTLANATPNKMRRSARHSTKRRATRALALTMKLQHFCFAGPWGHPHQMIFPPWHYQGLYQHILGSGAGRGRRWGVSAAAGQFVKIWGPAHLARHRCSKFCIRIDGPMAGLHFEKTV
jgi:hypothetical protein